MRFSAWRSLVCLSAVAAVGAGIFGQVTTAAASPASGGTATRAAAAAARPGAPARTVTSSTYRPPRHKLRLGSRGPAVRRMQRRLAELRYYPGKVDGVFGPSTLEAVWAFKEAQGISTRHAANIVGPVMEQALVHPRLPEVLVKHHAPANRIEVNLKARILVLYHHKRIELISHVSTGGHYYYCSPAGGCGYAITPTGNFRIHEFLPGWVTVPLGTMYNPLFFIGTAYAIHGDIPVPLQNVSHGCVRIPMDIAQFFHRLVNHSASGGTRVYIRHQW